MNENQKQISISIIMAGFAVLISNIFIKFNLFNMIAKPIGYILIGMGALYLVAGEQIINIINRVTNKETHKLTPSEKLEQKKQEYQAKLQEQEWKLKIAKKQAEIDLVRAKTEKLKATTNNKGSFPNILNNLGFDNTQKKKEFDLRKLF